MPTHVRITNNLGGVFTPPIESRAVAELLVALHGGCYTADQTAASMAAHNQLRDGQTFEHARGYTFEPIDVQEQAQ